MQIWHFVQFNDDGFHLLAAHHGSHAATRCQARRSPITVADGDASQQTQIFGRFTVQLAQIWRAIVEGKLACFVDMQHNPVVCLTVQREPGNVHAPHGIGQRAATISFFDASRERAFAANADAVGVGESRAGQRSGGKNEGIVWSKWIHSCHITIDKGLRYQITTSFYQRFALDRLVRNGLFIQIDV